MKLEDQLAELMLRCKEVAALVGEGRDVFAECSYCHGALPLWEALFTQQISGVLAHIACPEEPLRKIVGAAAPLPEFPYESFVKAVDLRMEKPSITEAKGEIEVLNSKIELSHDTTPLDDGSE